MSGLMQTNLKSLPLVYRGKVRECYAVGQDKLLMIASDRISAFDYILPSEIPFKGEILTRISAFWFNKFADIVRNSRCAATSKRALWAVPTSGKPWAEHRTGKLDTHTRTTSQGEIERAVQRPACPITRTELANHGAQRARFTLSLARVRRSSSISRASRSVGTSRTPTRA